MQFRQAIARADALRPNMIDEAAKAEWLYQLECEIADMMKVKMTSNPWLSGGKDAELLMPAPHDGIYVLHLCAMIDNAQQETALYANDMTMANSAIATAKAWWRRSNRPAIGERFKVM